MKKIGVLLCLFAVLFFVLACQTTTTTTTATSTTSTKTTNTTTTTTQTTTANPTAYEDIAADYQIDITALGMPLVFYLRISPNGAFKLSTTRVFSDDKGNGTISKNEDVYTFNYSEGGKTATFIVEGKTLKFTSNLPYGASNITYQVVDTENPEITHTLTAMGYFYEPYWGEFVGSHEVLAMGQTVLYEYTVTLGIGARYQVVSNFTMSGTPYEYIETGEYRINGSVISLKADGEEQFMDGVIHSPTSFQMPIKASAMGTRALRDIAVYVPPVFAYAGEYFIDASYVGQNLYLFLLLDVEMNFELSYAPNQIGYITRGHVTESGGVYTLHYAIDSVNQTTSFTFEEGIILFESDLHLPECVIPYTFIDEWDDSYTLDGYLIAHTEVLGLYELEVGTVWYRLFLFTGGFYGQITDSGDDTNYEFGVFTLEGNSFTFYPEDDDEYTGTLESNGSITLPLSPDQVAPRANQTLHYQHQATIVGQYEGFKTASAGGMKMYETTAVLELREDGTYSYTGTDTVNGVVTESGTYVFSGNQVTFTVGGSSTTFTGRFKDGVLVAGFKVSTMSTSRTDIVFYQDTVIGRYEAQDYINEELYEFTLELFSDGTYHLTILVDSVSFLDEEGTFNIQYIEGAILVLRSGNVVRVGSFVPEYYDLSFLFGNQYEFIYLMKP